MKMQRVNFVDSLAPITSQAMPDNPLIIWSRRKCKLLYWELLRSTTTGNRWTCKKNAELKINSPLVRKFMSLRSFVVGAPGPHHILHEYMDGDGVGWPSLSHFGWETKPMWAYFIVILFSPFGSAYCYLFI